MKEVKIRIGRMGVRFLKEGKEWILSDLLYVNDLVLYGELEEDLKAMVGWFFEVSKRRTECKWWCMGMYFKFFGGV